MVKLVNRAKMTTATTGTGIITLGSAVASYQTFAASGVADGNVVRYAIEDGTNWEIGSGTYTATGTTLSRTPTESSSGGAAISLSGSAVVYATAAAADLQELVTFAETFVLPAADGTSGQVLTTNGSGALSFSTVSGGATDINGLSDGYRSGTNVALGGSEFGSINSGTAYGNTGLGYSVGYYLTTGSYNSALGKGALRGNLSYLTGSGNTGVGYETGLELSTGGYNFLGGYQSGYALTTGSNNVAIGNGALDAATTAGRNVAIGQDAMGLGVATTAAGDNVSIGYQAGYDLTTGNGNVLIGKGAGDDVADGGNNVFIGFDAGAAYVSASGNVAIGYRAALSATGTECVAVGQDAQRSATGTRNNSVGTQAGYSISTGNNNVSFGYNANYSCTTGTFNTALGNFANGVTTGSNNTLIGNSAAPSSATVSNEITLGNSSITRFRIPGIQAAASNGDVLTFDSANGILKLQAPAGGGLTLLSESTISSAASSVTVTFPDGYKVYQLVFKNVRQNVANEFITLERLNSSGSAIGTTSYLYSTHHTSTTVTSSTGANLWRITPSGMPPYTNSQAYAGLNFNFVFWGVRESTEYMSGVGEGNYLSASDLANIKVRMTASTAEQNNGIRIRSENGSSFTSGKILLYGVA